MLERVARSYREDRLARARRGGNDDTSAARVLLSMVALVAILLLGNLFWTAVTSLASAVGTISAQLPEDPFARPTAAATVGPGAAPTPAANDALPVASPIATVHLVVAPNVTRTSEVATPQPTPVPPASPTPAPTAASGRAPWVLLPQPEPGARVPRGAIVVAACGRGDAPIADIRLELDGAALHAQIEQRSDSIWLAQASTTVDAGSHAARAVVTDAGGRVGAYRWSFSVAP
jgi:hypothetical protein